MAPRGKVRASSLSWTTDVGMAAVRNNKSKDKMMGEKKKRAYERLWTTRFLLGRSKLSKEKSMTELTVIENFLSFLSYKYERNVGNSVSPIKNGNDYIVTMVHGKQNYSRNIYFNVEIGICLPITWKS